MSKHLLSLWFNLASIICNETVFQICWSNDFGLWRLFSNKSHFKKTKSQSQ